MGNAIEVSHLRRTFTSSIGVIKRTHREIVAVDDVSFEIQEGELFGLLGPNGAGKTTTTKMLTTLLIPTAGTASVAGFDVVAQADPVRRRIGFIFGGERGLYWRLSGIDNLRYFASLYNIDPDVTKKRIAYLLDMVGLNGRGDDLGVRGQLETPGAVVLVEAAPGGHVEDGDADLGGRELGAGGDQGVEPLAEPAVARGTIPRGGDGRR
jgi:ABC-type multidrug transport system ATPase subunit